MLGEAPSGLVASGAPTMSPRKHWMKWNFQCGHSSGGGGAQETLSDLKEKRGEPK